MKPKSIHPEFIKPIQTTFAESESSDEPAALQMIVDENLINVVIGMFLKIDTTYSVRELLALDPRLAMMRQLMTTTTIGMAIPQFKEEYGEGRPIDIVLTPSHEFMTNGLGNVNPTGVSIDANGNFQMLANVGAQIIVTNSDGEQEEARSLFIQFQLKGKMFIADAQHDNRTLVVMPKSLQMPIFKVLNNQGEEQFLEQMLVQSMVGFQLDNLKKAFKPATIPLKKFTNPRELQCLGFNLTNVAVKINKGYLQVNGNYIRLTQEDVDTEFCSSFEERVNNSPAEIFKKITGMPIFDNPVINKLLKDTSSGEEKAIKSDL